MRKTGYCLICAAILVCCFGFSIDTTVVAESGIRVHNLGLMQDQQNALLFAGALFVGGVILFAFGKKEETAEETAVDPSRIPYPASRIPYPRGPSGSGSGASSLAVKAARDQVQAFHKIVAAFELNASSDLVMTELVNAKVALENFSDSPESESLPKFTANLKKLVQQFAAVLNSGATDRSTLLDLAIHTFAEAKLCLNNYQHYSTEDRPESKSSEAEETTTGTKEWTASSMSGEPSQVK
jgi:hypothetical protein